MLGLHSLHEWPALVGLVDVKSLWCIPLHVPGHSAVGLGMAYLAQPTFVSAFPSALATQQRGPSWAEFLQGRQSSVSFRASQDLGQLPRVETQEPEKLLGPSLTKQHHPGCVYSELSPNECCGTFSQVSVHVCNPHVF